MKVSILDDYCDTLRTLDCFGKLDGHDVTVWTDHTDDVDVLASRLQDTEVLVLIRERTAIRAPLLFLLRFWVETLRTSTPVARHLAPQSFWSNLSRVPQNRSLYLCCVSAPLP